MSNETKNHIPAFSCVGHSEEFGGVYQEGMSLRDYFAGQALVGLLSGPYRDNGTSVPIEVAQECYLFADELISERKQKTGAM